MVRRYRHDAVVLSDVPQRGLRQVRRFNPLDYLPYTLTRYLQYVMTNELSPQWRIWTDGPDYVSFLQFAYSIIEEDALGAQKLRSRGVLTVSVRVAAGMCRTRCTVRWEPMAVHLSAT